MGFIRNPNQQDLSWFVDMLAQERLELNPPYQRKSVWTSKDKQFFLDTIFNNYPCPAIYLQKETTSSGPLYNVVDGKQRLSTILDFHNGKIRLSKTFGISELIGKKFKDLSEDRKGAFYNYVFMVEQIRADDSDDVEWGEVFQRVNKNQKKLTDQELRHARFDGWLIRRAEEEVASKSLWQDLGISSKARASRMKDVEFISILMLVILEKDFIGFPQVKIEELYAKYDFELQELPEDEATLAFEDNDEVEFDGITKEVINDFESEFNKLFNFISKMNSHNSCILNHKKRLFTDFYSIWSVLVFEKPIIDLGFEKVAALYHEFILEVDKAFTLAKDGEPLDQLDSLVHIYHAHSTGAATEVDSRKKRYKALADYIKNNND